MSAPPNLMSRAWLSGRMRALSRLESSVFRAGSARLAMRLDAVLKATLRIETVAVPLRRPLRPSELEPTDLALLGPNSFG